MKGKTDQDLTDGLVLTIPISDTMPGPGNIQFPVESLEDWQAKYLVEDPDGAETEPGAGTAQDVGSTDRLPEPGL